jgi:hypothetical protein
MWLARGMLALPCGSSLVAIGSGLVANHVVTMSGKIRLFHFGWKNTLRLKLRHTVALCTRDNKKRDYIRTNTIAKLVKSS